jgi:hypothetical protein
MLTRHQSQGVWPRWYESDPHRVGFTSVEIERVDGLPHIPEDDLADEPWSTVLDLFARDTESPAVKLVYQRILKCVLFWNGFSSG